MASILHALRISLSEDSGALVCSDGLAVLQVSCSWGYTTGGGAKGVGDSTTSAVVISLVLIFIADFFLSFLFFQGQGDALKQLK